jgi:hypothetical protein
MHNDAKKYYERALSTMRVSHGADHVLVQALEELAGNSNSS